MKLTPIDIQQQQFGRQMRGYGRTEVDAFLEIIGEQLGEVARENADLKIQLKCQEEELGHHRDRESTMREALITAQRALEEIRDNAQKEAHLIISDAELKAEKILHNAHGRVSRILEDVSELKRQRIRAIEELRGVLNTHEKLLDVHTESVATDETDEDASVTVLGRLRAPAPPAEEPTGSSRFG